MRRLRAFGIEPKEYFEMQPKVRGYLKIRKDVQNAFYTLGDSWRLKMADEFQVRYFVLDKRFRTKTSQLPVVFENDSFVVLDAK